MDLTKQEEIRIKVIELESTLREKGVQLDALRQQLNTTNIMLIQIKEGILGNEFNKGIVAEIHEVRRNVNELKKETADFKNTMKNVQILEKDLEMLKSFKIKQEHIIAKGMGLLAGITLVFNAIYSWIEHKFLK